MQTLPRERALNEWQRRLDGQLRANLAGDLLAQLFMVAAYLFYPSVWVIALWITRWFVIGTIWIGWRRVASPDPTAPVLIVLVGHLVGAVIATVIVPQFGAITVLIVIGDLQMSYDYFPPNALVTYRRFAALMVGVLSLLTLQDWTRAAEGAPRWLLLVFLVGHGCGVSLLLARQTWQSISLAREQGQALAVSRQRLQLAADEARRDLSETIRAGPRRQLVGARDLLHGMWNASGEPLDPVLATRALAMTESVIHSLRDVGHGLFPPELPSMELGAALGSLRWEHSPNLRIDCTFDPAPAISLRETIIEIAAEVASWARRWRASAELIAADRTPGGVNIAFTLSCPSPALEVVDLRRRLGDLAGAAGGEMRLLVRGRRLIIFGTLAEAAVPVADDSRPARGGSKAAALEPYLRGSFALSIGGLVLIAIVYTWRPTAQLVTLGLVVAIVSVGLAFAGRAVRRGRALQALALTAAASTLAACGLIILLPDTAPMLVVFTALPLTVAPWITTSRQFGALIVLQQLTAAFILTVLVVDPASALSELLPSGLIAAVLFFVSVSISGLLIRVYVATKLSLDRDNRLLQASRTEIVTVARGQRQELERDLHDGAQQVVVALAVHLRVFLRRLSRDAAAARPMVRQLIELANEADIALADFSAGSYPTILIEHGLQGGIQRLARICPYPTTVTLDLKRSLPASIELTTYFCCSEALQNVAKHAGQRATVKIGIRGLEDDLHFEVIDTGQGYDRTERVAGGRGLENLEARVARLLGDLEVVSSVGHGCVVRGRLPIERPDAIADAAA